jgi:hypothetical protein
MADTSSALHRFGSDEKARQFSYRELFHYQLDSGTVENRGLFSIFSRKFNGT